MACEMMFNLCPDCTISGGSGGDGCALSLNLAGGWHTCPGAEGILFNPPQCFKTSIDDDVEYHLTPVDENGVQCLWVVWGYWWANQYDFAVCGKFSSRNGGTTLCLTEPSGNTFKVCVTGCDGEILANATVNAEGCNDPSDDSEPACFASSGTTDEDGCVELSLPLLRWRRGQWPNSVTVTVAPWTPPGEEEPVYAGKTVTFPNVGPGDEFTVTLDPATGYTCCDLDFRKETDPGNPSGAPYHPRPKTMLFVTSASTGDEAWDLEVGCDGNVCSLSDSVVSGGRPTVVTCPPGDFSDGPWDHWEPPALGTSRVPALVRIWFDGTDWHCSMTVKYTVARPPREDMGGCNSDPTQQISDLYGWFRTDAECDNTQDPKLSIDPDPVLVHPVGGDWYSGETTDVTVTSASYSVTTNNPVNITFHFDPITIVVGHNVSTSVSIVSSITAWQPE